MGSVGQPGGIFFTPRPVGSALPQPHTFSRETTETIRALLINDANPVFGTPSAWRMKESLSKIPYIVSFGHFIDETSVLADLILPDHSFLESWVDHVAESGAKQAVAGVAPPAMKPIHRTRAMPDVLLEVGRRLKNPLSPALPETYEAMLKAAFSPKELEQGGSWAGAQRFSSVGTLSERPAPLQADPQFDGDANLHPYHFLPYASQQFFDGSLAHLPWLQELPDVVTTAMWSSWVEINPKTAKQLGVAQGDLVEVASAHGSVRAPVYVSPGIAPDVIAMPVGQGHETFTRYASGRGANPIAILAPMTEPETGALAWAATRVRVSKIQGDGGLILFSRGMGMTEQHHSRG